jgi:hypothetical protein
MSEEKYDAWLIHHWCTPPAQYRKAGGYPAAALSLFSLFFSA